MSAKQALLMDIHYSDGSGSLYLMTGQGFELLHEDKNGREVYGLRHNDRDYLFFPFSFKPVGAEEAGTLSVHLPPEYEESCLDHRADGARIVFGSVRGVPFFPEMPKEFQTNTGVLCLDPSGSLRVVLDKAGEGIPPSGQAECGCGHDHARSGQPEEAESHAGCGCGHGHHHDHGRHGHGESLDAFLIRQRRANDEELARNIRRAAEALNEALLLGFEAGLTLHVGLIPSGRDEEADECPRVRILRIARPL